MVLLVKAPAAGLACLDSLVMIRLCFGQVDYSAVVVGMNRYQLHSQRLPWIVDVVRGKRPNCRLNWRVSRQPDLDWVKQGVLWAVLLNLGSAMVHRVMERKERLSDKNPNRMAKSERAMGMTDRHLKVGKVEFHNWHPCQDFASSTLYVDSGTRSLPGKIINLFYVSTDRFNKQWNKWAFYFCGVCFWNVQLDLVLQYQMKVKKVLLN